MAEKNEALPEDLLTAVAEVAQGLGRTPEEVIEAATRRYLARVRMDRLCVVAKNAPASWAS